MDHQPGKLLKMTACLKQVLESGRMRRSITTFQCRLLLSIFQVFAGSASNYTERYTVRWWRAAMKPPEKWSHTPWRCMIHSSTGYLIIIRVICRWSTRCMVCINPVCEEEKGNTDSSSSHNRRFRWMVLRFGTSFGNTTVDADSNDQYYLLILLFSSLVMAPAWKVWNG